MHKNKVTQTARLRLADINDLTVVAMSLVENAFLQPMDEDSNRNDSEFE